MGTTLALVGAYTLAGALSQHPFPTSTSIALAQYESELRPTVVKAQKVPPAWIVHRNSAWAVWLMRMLVWWVFGVLRLGLLLARFKGPPANEVPVREYGFREVGDGGYERRS